MSIRPAYLKKGDTIGMVCPSGYMAPEKMQKCIQTLQEWGYKIREGNTLYSRSENYFAGTDAERLQDLQAMLDDDTVKAVFCARGGYGLSRIIDHINFKRFRKHPKWIIGFSDITVLHAHIYSNFGIVSLHAPMAAAFNDGENDYILSLKNVLKGNKIKYACAPHPLNHTGKAKGELVGGNLALVTHLLGSSSDLKTKGKILFLEDIGEYLYNVDRMLRQLKRAGKLDKLAGLVVGKFIDMKDTERPFGKTVYEIIYESLKEYDYPVCFDFPVSHTKENYALKLAVKYELNISKERVQLKESG